MNKNENRYFSLGVAERTADIYIFGDITSWEWMESDVSSYTLARQLRDLDVDTINVHINSYGGEVSESLAIYNELRAHPAKVRTICSGFACSAASVVFMAGEERVMHEASLLMIHNAWSRASGNAKDLRKAADDLEKISRTAAASYRSKLTISDEELEKLLDEESWITPQEAVAWGFATAVLEHQEADKPLQSVRELVFAKLTAKAVPPAPVKPKEKTVATFLEALTGERR